MKPVRDRNAFSIAKDKSRIKILWWKLKDQAWLQVFALLGFAYIILFNFVPMYGILMAFKNYKLNMGIAGIFTSDWVGLKHFRTFFHEYLFGQLLRNTLMLSTLKLVLCFPIPILLAIMLQEMPNPKYRKIVQTVSYLPHFISWVVCVGIANAMFSSELGVIQDVLVNLGFKKVPLLTSPDYFWGFSAIMSCWKSSGWWAIIFLASIMGIDPQLYEAAIVDGAGRLKRIWHITLPGLRSAIVTMLILSIGSFLGGGMVGSNFEQSYLFGNAMNYDTSEIIQVYSFKVGLKNGQVAYATAISVVESMVSLFLIFSSNFISKKITGEGLF